MPIKDFSPKDWIVILISVIIGALLVGAVIMPMLVETRDLTDSRANVASALIGSLIMIISQHITTTKN